MADGPPQLVVVYDVTPGGRMKVFDTAYSEADLFDVWLQCLNEHGKDSNPRAIRRPGSGAIEANVPTFIPRRPT